MLFLIILTICVYALFAIRWGERTFDTKSINQMIYHLVVPCDGTDEGVYESLFKETIPGTLITMIVVGVVLHYTSLKVVYQHQLLSSVIAALITIVVALFMYRIPQYLVLLMQKTDLYEKYYVDPHQAKIEFPVKRNLIHIYLESVENTYLNHDIGGQGDTNYIPELGKLCQKELNFSGNKMIGGSRTIEGTQWTIGSMVGQEAGVPLFFTIDHKYNYDSKYLPGCKSIGEILEEQGYVNELLQGSDANFGCTSNFFKQHGHYQINDYDEMKKQGRLPEDYLVFWGYEDRKLFEFVKEDLTELSKHSQPFHLEMVTIDTHTPDGYVCDNCQNQYDEQYANVIACQSRQVNEFVSWCQKQEWYENTTIVITGDHNSMSGKFFGNIEKNYIRTPYNCFINSALQTTNNKEREFAIFDFYPTILASIGAKIEGDRLGLGTNLFSNRKTLMEDIGFKTLNKEVKKRSEYYQKKILKQ